MPNPCHTRPATISQFGSPRFKSVDSSHRNASWWVTLDIPSVVRGVDGMAFFARQRTQALSNAHEQEEGRVEVRIVACDLIKYAALFLIPGLFIIRCALSIGEIP